jgi:hypothetical protein
MLLVPKAERTAAETGSRDYQVVEAVPTTYDRKLTRDDIDLLDQYCASIKRTRVLRSHVSAFSYFSVIEHSPTGP